MLILPYPLRARYPFPSVPLLVHGDGWGRRKGTTCVAVARGKSLELTLRKKTSVCKHVRACVPWCISLEPLTMSLSSLPCLKDPSVGILTVASETCFPTLGGNWKSIKVSQSGKESSESALKLVLYISHSVSQFNMGNPQRRAKANHFFDGL